MLRQMQSETLDKEIATMRMPVDGLKILLECSQLYLRLGLFRQSKEILEGILAVEPNLAVAYVFLGNCLVAEGKQNEAIFFYRKAIDIEPNNNFALVNLAEALLMLKRGKEAFEILEKVNLANDGCNSNLAKALIEGKNLAIF